MTAKIVLLNGVGSAGKSSIARALQTIATEPFLHVQMDAFIDMLPPALQDHADGFSFETVLEDGKPSVVIRSGPVGARTMRGMRHAIAGQGNNLIVDDVIFNDEIAEYVELLSSFDLHLVGVMAPLEVLEAREAARADRLPGLARWQYGRIHRGIDYDLEVDTSRLTPLECARRIQERFRL
ncbi:MULTISPECIES: chloramphenicol phosphotransferase [unclassified Mesorhizobium]|uniref:chloramphenicol phosphotransferase CPT family protein n=1 Tax=unclassified Mesorhizobium TaxID=325217 RepID=UPI00333AB8A5